MMQRLLILVIGYLIGGFQTAIVISKVRGMDIREHGSGNAGATNTLRVLGKKSAIIVFLGDMLKTVIAILLARLIWGPQSNLPTILISIYAGIGTILGHNWPVYFQFKGGKGIAVSAATLLMLDYRVGLIGIVVFLVCVAITRYVSLSSILLTLSAPISLAIFYLNSDRFIEIILVSLLIPILAIYRHLANIQRLLKGTESKLGEKRSNM